MNRLLKRQIKRYFGESFDLSLMPQNFSSFIEDISNSYDDFYEEKKFLEHTIDINSQDIERANIKLKKLLDETSGENQEMYHMLKQYKEAMDTSLIVSTTTTDGIIKYVNENFVRISGYSKDELIGKSHNIVKHPSSPKALFNDMWRTIMDKKVWQGVFANMAKDGSTYYVDATIFPLLNTNNEIVEFMALRKDMTANIEYQHKLETQKQRVSAILDNQESIIVLFDETIGVVEVNRKFYEIFGFKSLEEFRVKHRCICELFEQRDDFLQKSTDGKLCIAPILEDPYKVHLALINKKVYSVKIATINIENKKIYLATFTDITEIEEARIRSLEAQREKSNFLANMSHEIRTPMNAILGFSELLSKTELDIKQSKYAKLIKNSTTTLIEIINDILDFSKLESGHGEIDLVNVNPFMEFEDTFMLLAQRAREKSISYIIDIDSTLLECLKMDSFHIKQILMNLIGNAIKFTHEQGTVYVGISKEVVEGQNRVRFVVQDNGIGIPQDRQEKIFEPFSQADSSTTRKFGGTGLGLSISNSLVKLMGSKLFLQSKEGEGSKFYFDIDFIDCKSKNTLREHLREFKIYIGNPDEESKEHISKQLNDYKLDFKVITEFDESIDMNNSIIISKDQFFVKKFKNAIVLMLAKADHCKNKMCRHIEFFDDFHSNLYNELMRLKIIDTNIKTKQDRAINLKVLVAEDYEVNRVLISEILNNFKIEYTFALNGQEAVEKALKESYDLILMDINMPVMNGMDATKVLINDFKLKTPIVALTANALNSDKERFLSIGMLDYLTKPIDIEAFEAILVKYANFKSRHSYSQKADIAEKERERFDVESSLKKAQNRMNLSKNIIDKLFNSYISSLDETAKKLQEAIYKRDFETILINAHNLKSGAASLCFEEIAKISQELESNAKSKNENFDFLKKFEELKLYLEIIGK